MHGSDQLEMFSGLFPKETRLVTYFLPSTLNPVSRFKDLTSRSKNLFSKCIIPQECRTIIILNYTLFLYHGTIYNIKLIHFYYILCLYCIIWNSYKLIPLTILLLDIYMKWDIISSTIIGKTELGRLQTSRDFLYQLHHIHIKFGLETSSSKFYVLFRIQWRILV